MRSWAGAGEHLTLNQLSKEGAKSFLSNCTRTPDKGQEWDDNSLVPEKQRKEHEMVSLSPGQS